ncbi:MAG: hypothetical protein OER88_00025 [Planctomycetota bacterium]|nr:hypothetical protein [Planctomycetota bacterium]
MKCLSLLLVVFLLGAPLDDLLAAGKYAEAVAQAQDPAALLAAAVKLKNTGGLIQEVLKLRGVLKDPTAAGEWLSALSDKRGGDARALTSAGYLFLRANKPGVAVIALERSVQIKPTGVALAYLANAHRRNDDLVKATKAATDAAGHRDAPQPFLRDIALNIGARWRGANDLRYIELLQKNRLGATAGMWLAADAGNAGMNAATMRKRAAELFATSLGDSSPAIAWWSAARVTNGAVRTRYLIEAVRRGESEMQESDHACPGAVLALAQECARAGRAVAAAALARKRLRIGACEAAWDVLESLPPHLARER